MSRFKVYIKPFEDDGTYASEFTDVTMDVLSFASIKETIDADEFDTGIFKFNQFTLSLNNFKGKYSDVGTPVTIFKYKRSNSLVRVTWQIANDDIQIGTAVLGNAQINLEQQVFLGLLNDESLVTNIDTQQANFRVLGLESIFREVATNFSSISNGDSLSTIAFTVLNQTAITDVLTVDAGNISFDNNLLIDDKSEFENQTVEETIKDVLAMGNSVLYVKDETVFIAPRTPSASVQKTFYGQASNLGIENVTSINNIRSGLNKLFNFVTFKDTSILAQNATNIAVNGVRKKEVDFSYITDTSKRTSLVTSILTEFGNEKQELVLTTPIDYTVLDLFILDRVAIDYPTVFTPFNGEELPILGQVILGEFSLPVGQWALTLDTSTNYKIMERTLLISNQQARFKLREI